VVVNVLGMGGRGTGTMTTVSPVSEDVGGGAGGALFETVTVGSVVVVPTMAVEMPGTMSISSALHRNESEHSQPMSSHT